MPAILGSDSRNKTLIIKISLDIAEISKIINGIMDNDSAYFLPSEVARLILGLLRCIGSNDQIQKRQFFEIQNTNMKQTCDKTSSQ